MSKIQPFRGKEVEKADDLRVRLNELVDILNERSLAFKTLRIPDYQSGMTLTLNSPGFQVGAIVVGGVTPTNFSTVPSVAPWANWTQQADGRITIAIGGLTALQSYAINLILFQAGGTL